MAYTANEARYSAMQYARSGRSGLALPRVALGLWHNFGSQDVFDTMRETLCAAFDSGITYFDLANNYGPVPGSAEENFGRILHGELAAHRDELVVATKAGYRMWPGPYGNGGSRKAMLASLDQSLARMRLSYVDIFYSHRMDPETPLEETMGALASAVRQGKALYAGLSNYDGETAARAAALLEAGGCPFVVCQNRYSMLDRTVEHNGLLAFARGAGKGVVAFSPLAQGLLSGRYLHGIPQGSRIARGNSVRMTPQALTPALMQGLEKLGALAAAGAVCPFVGAFGAGCHQRAGGRFQRGTAARKRCLPCGRAAFAGRARGRGRPSGLRRCAKHAAFAQKPCARYNLWAGKEAEKP